MSAAPAPRSEPAAGAPEEEGGTQGGELPAIICLPDLSQPPPKRPVPWRGRPRVADPHSAWLPPWRAKPELRAKVLADAKAAGLSYGAYMRELVSGDPGPRARRQSPVDVTELTRLLAQIGKLGSNHNQLAHAFNATGETPERAAWDRQEQAIQEMRRAIMKALGYAD